MKEKILLKNRPTIKEYPDLVEYLLGLGEEKAVLMDKSDTRFKSWRKDELPIETTCPNCQKKTVLAINTEKQLFFCFDCSKGGGYVKIRAFNEKRTVKEIINELVLEKVHPLLRLTESQIAILGHKPSFIHQLEQQNDVEKMDEIYFQWTRYENEQLSFIYSLFLFATLRKDSEEMNDKLRRLSEYAINMRIRADFFSQCSYEFMNKVNHDILTNELKKPSLVYIGLQQERIALEKRFISLETVIKDDLFQNGYTPRKEWALQGEYYARKVFEQWKKTNRKTLDGIELYLFQSNEYKKMRERYKK